MTRGAIVGFIFAISWMGSTAAQEINSQQLEEIQGRLRTLAFSDHIQVSNIRKDGNLILFRYTILRRDSDLNAFQLEGNIENVFLGPQHQRYQMKLFMILAGILGV